MMADDVKAALGQLDAVAGKLRDALGDTYADEQEIQRLAVRFCQLDDDSQARFFVACAEIMSRWEDLGAMDRQAHFIGRHLKECECSSGDARELVRGIYFGMERQP